MHDSYSDIYERIKEPPDWYDVNGCPRWGSLREPEHLHGRIRCQLCGKIFLVSLATPVYRINLEQMLLRCAMEIEGISDGNIEQADNEKGAAFEFLDGGKNYRLAKDWHYGDPPAHGCVGDTMNSEPEWSWAERDSGGEG